MSDNKKYPLVFETGNIIHYYFRQANGSVYSDPIDGQITIERETATDRVVGCKIYTCLPLTELQAELLDWVCGDNQLGDFGKINEMPVEDVWEVQQFLIEVDGATRRESLEEFLERCTRLVLEYGAGHPRVRMMLNFQKFSRKDKYEVAEAVVSLRQLSDDVEEANKPPITPDGLIPVPAWMDVVMGWAPLALLAASAVFAGVAIFADLPGKIVSVFGAGMCLALACNAWMAVRCVNEAKRRKDKGGDGR